MDQTAEPIPAQNTHTGHAGGRLRTTGGRGLPQRPLRPVGIVLARDQPQVPYTGDQHPVQALAAGAGDPAFRDGVGPHCQLHPIQMIDTAGFG